MAANKGGHFRDPLHESKELQACKISSEEGSNENC